MTLTVTERKVLMEKKKLPYEEAKIEVIKFENADIITLSGNNIDDFGVDGNE